MTLRTRLLLAFAAIVLIPIGLLAFGIRQEMTKRLSQEYQVRVDGVVAVIRDDLERESAGIAARLSSIARALLDDNRFRSAAIAGVESDRDYLLDYAGTAMRLTGLSMLQVHDADGRIISSGHFRNEHGRAGVELTALDDALGRAPGDVVLASVRAPAGSFLAIVRTAAFEIAGRQFTLVGGVQIDDDLLERMTRDPDIGISLTYPGGAIGSAAPAGDVAIGRLPMPLIRPAADRVETVEATLQVTQPLVALRALLRSADSWFLTTAVAAGVVALVLAVWVSSRISRPLAALAEKTAVLDLDRLDVEFDASNDEVGALSRLLGDMASRLRTSTVKVREAERRATVGDLARQVNHDIKNGLIPLRNVMRHLGQVSHDEPGALPSVFAERRHTIDSSLGYLETLAASYQKLSTPLERRECDLNGLIAEVVRAAQGRDLIEITADLAPDLPRVIGDRVAFRRILENLMTNAVDSLETRPGRVTVTTQTLEEPNDRRVVRITVADTGRGMSSEEAGQIFNDFYTTKAGGAGLGLSIVRRLVMDLQGTIDVDSAPGKGTRINVDLPAAASARL